MSGLGLDIDGATVLFYDDVVAHRKSKPGSFTGRLCREERVEHLFLDLGRNTRAVVANPDFDGIAEIFGCGPDDGIKARTAILRLALGDRIIPVCDQIQEYAGNLLRKHFDHARRLVEVALQSNIELRLFGA